LTYTSYQSLKPTVIETSRQFRLTCDLFSKFNENNQYHVAIFDSRRFDYARPQLIAEHHKALTPKLSWMVTDQSNFTVSSFLALGLMYCALTSAAIEPVLPDDMISMLIFLGKDTNTKLYVERLVMFTLFSHLLEGFFVVYLCKSKLKVGNLATSKWFLLVLATGFCTTRTLWFLVRLDKPKIKEDAKEK